MPGEQHYLIPAGRFKDLVQAFRGAHFFNIPRTDPRRIVTDVPVIRLTYRDERKIHEVVDVHGQNTAITDLENRFKVATDVGRYGKPSVSLYRSLVHSGWNVNALGADHQNELSAAVLNRDLESIRFLLESWSIATDEALTYAAMSDNLEILRLVMTGSRTKLTGGRGALALVQAARSPSTDLLRYLLDSGISSNPREANSGFTPLMSAVMNGRLANTRLLLAKGADPNASDSSGRRALWYAAAATNTGFITLLLQYGADVNAADRQGQTALMNAASRCYTWDIEALLKGGADPTIKDKRAKTAVEATLMAAADPKCAAAHKMLAQAMALNCGGGRSQ